jgi:hypothetical protein
VLVDGVAVTHQWWFAWRNKSFDGTEHDVFLAGILWIIFSVSHDDLSCSKLLVENLFR